MNNILSLMLESQLIRTEKKQLSTRSLSKIFYENELKRNLILIL